jgi:hypothetical protein
LEAIVNSYRNGTCNRYAAFSALLRELESEPQLSEQEKDTTFGLYCAEVNSTEVRALQSIDDPLQPEHERPARLDAAGNGKSRERTEAHPRGTIELIDQLSKRTVSEGPDTDDEEDGKTHKKPKLLESEMPWARSGRTEGLGTNPASKPLNSSRTRRGQVQFLVRWKGQGPEDDLWEPAKNFTHAKETLREYKRTHKL